MQSRQQTGRVLARPQSFPLVECPTERSWYRQWLSLDDHRLRLVDDWCKLHWRLEGQTEWFSLSDAERAEVEKASGLSDLDTILHLIHRRLRRWLRVLPSGPTNELAVVAARLRVAERLLPAEENAAVHALIAGAVRDLTVMQKRAPGRQRQCDRHLAATFCKNARSFLAMARSQTARSEEASPYYLAIAIELGLKAYLLHRGIADHWNKIHIRHDLIKALRCVRRAGLKDLPEGIRELSHVLSPLYASGALSRNAVCPVMPLPPNAADQAISQLLTTVEVMIGAKHRPEG
jgi:hypothetical protein